MIWRRKKAIPTNGRPAEEPHVERSHEAGHEPTREASQRKPSRRGLLIGGAISIGVCAIGVGLLAIHHSSSEHGEARERQDQESKGRAVEVAEVKKSPDSREIELIAEARPFLADRLYGRVSGYVKQVLFDKGDIVKEGQLLAVIESPETDRSYLGALADARNKAHIARRMRVLLKQKLVAPQEAEEAIAASDIANSVLETQRVLKSYEEVRAPFDGTVTSRLVDPGNLVQNATAGAAGAQLLATVSQTSRLRIYTYVDQRDAAFVRVGDEAEIRLQERPDAKFAGKVARVASELDPKTRKMLTEVDLDNLEGQIVSGSFVRVRLKVATPSYTELPVKALVMRDNHAVVPVVKSDNAIHFQPVEVLDNDGELLRVASGVQPGDKVALDLGGTVTEGTKVQPRPMVAEQHGAPPYPSAPAGASGGAQADKQQAGAEGSK